MEPVPFVLFGTAHNVVMALNVVVTVAVIRIVRRSGSARVTRVVCVVLAFVLAANQVVNWGYRLVADGAHVFVLEHMPLHLCGISAILSVVVLVTRNRLSYELLYFWGLAGATNAVVTPELVEGWPEYQFIQYYISHCGIVVAAAFATWGLGMRPTFRSLLRAFAVLNVLALVVSGVNLATGANYMYLSEMPTADSPFLFFDWPWYILWLEFLAFVFFLICYLPVHLERRRVGAGVANGARLGRGATAGPR